MTAPRKAGRPTFDPSDAQRQTVQVMRANGIALTAIATHIKCSPTTLRRAFRAELANGHETVKASLSAALVRAGLRGNVFAIKYWLSTHGGPEWRVTEGRDHSGGINVREQPTDELERELKALRDRQATFDRDGDLAADLSDQPEGVLH